jgi:polyphosphate kinase 2 (PPK2 family)
VSIELTAFERGEPFQGDLAAAITALQERIAHTQRWQIGRRKRAIIVFEGLEGGGKAAALKMLSASLDPRFVTTQTVAPDRRRSDDGHWLARFWRDLPGDRRSVLYFHSWYRRVLEDRLLGLVDGDSAERAFDEINEFEAQQRDHGTLILKLFFHVTEIVRSQRLSARDADPAERLLAGSTDLRGADVRAEYDVAVEQMFAMSNTRWSPWTVIDANDEGSAMVAALGAVADAMEKAFPEIREDEDGSVVPLRRSSKVSPA